MAESAKDDGRPQGAPAVVTRDEFRHELDLQVKREKAVTRLNDLVSAARRRLPMVEVEDYSFTGPDGPVRLTELFGGHQLLLVQNFMFAPTWDDGCPSCSYAVDCLPRNMERFDDEGIAFALISQAPIEKLESWRRRRGWDVTWVSSHDTTYHEDWGWTVRREDGTDGPVPGQSYYLLRDGVPYLTYETRARGTEAIVSLVHVMDRTVYGRQQDWEDSPPGWPQFPTYG